MHYLREHVTFDSHPKSLSGRWILKKPSLLPKREKRSLTLSKSFSPLGKGI